jgi:primosomal protein N' (replication factor Y)
VRNQYIWELLVKLPKASAQTHRVKQAIQESITAVQQSKSHFRSVRIFADVDPV